MSNGNTSSQSEERKAVLKILQSAKELYILMSPVTRLPYVTCDPETYDDEILLFEMLEDAKKTAEKLKEEKTLVQIQHLVNEQFLACLSSLYPMGVNCIVMDHGTGRERKAQLSELVNRIAEEKLPKGQRRVENPELHLTAIYYKQLLAKGGTPENAEERRQLEEEMMAHFLESDLIVPVSENQEVPLLKGSDGKLCQPFFTDLAEFLKFGGNKGMKTSVVKAKEMGKAISSKAEGLVINPFGVSIQLQVNHPAKDQGKA